MSVVYKAEDTNWVGLATRQFFPDDVARDPQALECFRGEERAASALSHPNIGTTHGIGKHSE